MAVTCPCCGQSIIGDGPASLTVMRLPPQERAVLMVLTSQFPGGMTYNDVRSILYGEGAGDAEDKVPGIIVHRLRKKVEAMGWTIPDARTMGDYRLVRL